MLLNYAMDLCHYHWRWFQPKNWVMIWFCFANHLIWGSRWHFSWTRRKSIHQVEIFRLIELDTSIQLSLSNPCSPPARFMIRNTFFFLRIWPKIPHMIKIFVQPVGRPTIFFDAAGGAQVPYWWFGQYLFIMRCSFFPENVLFIMKCV